MKKLHSVFALMLLTMVPFLVTAQDVLVVNPGAGTLNDAIAANKGNKIYKLQAGQWYQLTAPIENDTFHLQIIGETPAAGQMPATLQTNQTAEGSVFDKMFDAYGDITLKNIYFVNADLTAQIGGAFLQENKTEARVIIDSCIIHPASYGNAVIMAGAREKLYFTNNLAIDMGHQLNPNDGHFFVTDNSSGYGIDTLYVENNTFVCMGTNMHAGGFAKYVHNFVYFNHNTWALQKSQIDWTTWKNEFYWMNNLMFDMQTQPWATSWQPMPGADVSAPLPDLVYADTLPSEVLPSTRIAFVEYNDHYRAQGFYDLVTKLNQIADTGGKVHVYLQPLIWPKDSTDSREAQMFNSTGFPNFKYGNTYTDTDPQWNDATIYSHEDSLISWTYPASMVHALGYSSDMFPAASTWPQWHWYPSGDPSYNSVWPVFDGTYKNADMLKGSIEGLPLGDLNWYPNAKAVWEAHKAEINAHIAAGNTDKMDLGYTEGIKSNKLSVGIYPNPVSDVLQISGAKTSDVVITTLEGRTVKMVKNVHSVSVSDLNNGMYLITIKQGNASSTQKIVVNK